MTVENWLPIPGFEGFYEVSDLGRVKSCARAITVTGKRAGRRPISERILVATPNSEGYLVVGLHGPSGRKMRAVHKLVALAFLGEPEGRIVLHGVAGKPQNGLHNLRYGSYADNMADAIREGTFPKGSRNGAARLTEETVGAIKAMPASVHSARIAAVVGVSRTMIGLIRHGRKWSHVPAVLSETSARLLLACGLGKDAYDTAAGHYAAYQGSADTADRQRNPGRK